MRILLLFIFILGVSSNTCTCPEACSRKEELGRSTWFLLHSIVKYNKDTLESRMDLGIFMEHLSYLYPCEECRTHLAAFLRENNPEMTEEWMCMFHNEVNERLGKPLWDCYSNSSGLLSRS